MKTCKEIIQEWLIKEGHDGLCNDECGCSVEDLAPCGDGPYPNCMVAKDVGEKQGYDHYFEPIEIVDEKKPCIWCKNVPYDKRNFCHVCGRDLRQRNQKPPADGEQGG
jgi:hypothetical protein